MLKKTIMGSVWVFIVAVFVLFIYIEVVTEATVARWETRVQKVEYLETVNLQVQQSQEYSESLLSVISEISAQNIWMFNRETNAQQIVAEYEEENRRLMFSLSDAVERLESQQVEINDLIDQNDRLSYKVEVLERAIIAIEEAEVEVEILDADGPEALPVQ